MDGSPEASGPFFEQLYPYERAIQSRRVQEEDDYSLVPLTRFDLPRYLQSGAEARGGPFSPVRVDPGSDDAFLQMSADAASEFERFYKLVMVQIAQYGMEEYTENQMRVLGAVTAMHSPPGAVEKRTAFSRNLVAAAEGQTDDNDADRAVVSQGLVALDGGVELSYTDIPPDLAERWLATLVVRHPPRGRFYDELTFDLQILFGDLLKEEVCPDPDTSDGIDCPARTRLNSLDEATIKAWLSSWLKPGKDRTLFATEIRSTALQKLVQGLPQRDRDEVETSLLLEQVDEAISKGMDPDGRQVSPAEFTTLASTQWSTVLGRNRYEPEPITQGRGAIDPTAICTTLDGREALDEKSFGSVYLDVLTPVEDAAIDACADIEDDVAREDCRYEAAIWSNRGTLPFLLIDDPRVNRPDLTRLVGLPGERSLYRVRWRIWSGWHLFWAPEKYTDGDVETTRMALRTGAICEDTVLANADVVPTLVRAALLDGPFRPTTPVRGRVKKAPPEEEGEARDAEAALAEGQAAAESGQSKVTGAIGTATSAREDPTSLGGAGDIEGTLDSLSGEALLEDEAALPEPVKYIRGIVQPPLQSIATDEGGILLAVFDASAAGPRQAAWELIPRTPYVRERRRVGGGEHVRTAAWSLYVDAEPKAPSRALVSPAYRPRPSVESEKAKPHWWRNHPKDWTLYGGVGGFPVRWVFVDCNDAVADAQNQDVVLPCGERPKDEYLLSEGFSAEVWALGTWWWLDRPRLGVELGVEARLDAMQQGDLSLLDTQWFADRVDFGENVINQEDPFDYAWTFRPSGGLVLGLKQAPRPVNLWRYRSQRYPWGAAAPDGSSDLGRFQYGVREGLLLGPGFSGMEVTWINELWMGWSIRNARSPHATFTPYHPALVLGPYVRYQRAWHPWFVEGEDRYLELANSHTLIVGARLNLRFKNKADNLPEAP